MLCKSASLYKVYKIFDVEFVHWSSALAFLYRLRADSFVFVVRHKFYRANRTFGVLIWIDCVSRLCFCLSLSSFGIFVAVFVLHIMVLSFQNVQRTKNCVSSTQVRHTALFPNIAHFPWHDEIPWAEIRSFKFLHIGLSLG